MDPPREGLGTDDLASRQFHLRLKGEGELVIGKRLAQRRVHALAIAKPVVHRGLEQRDAIARKLLGDAQRHVGMAEEGLRVVA